MTKSCGMKNNVEEREMSEKKRYIFLLIIMENVTNIHLHVKIGKGDSF